MYIWLLHHLGNKELQIIKAKTPKRAREIAKENSCDKDRDWSEWISTKFVHCILLGKCNGKEGLFYAWGEYLTFIVRKHWGSEEEVMLNITSL